METPPILHSSFQISMADSHSISINDFFDRLPDSLLLQIFNSLSDVKTLIRCRSLSKRFNSLIPHTDSLLLKIDYVISSDSSHDDSDNNDSLLIGFFKSILKSLFDLISVQSESQNSPSQILRQFHRIRNLEIEFPSVDLNLEKGGGVKWKAEFGKSLRSCVILMFRGIRVSEQEVDLIGEMKVKTKVFWTIRTLITASARHHVLKEVVEEHRELERLVLRDRDGEGMVVMDKRGLEALRKQSDGGDAEEEEEWEWRRTRTRVPSARVRMRHQPWLELRGGIWMEDATLVVVRPRARPRPSQDDDDDDVDWAHGRDDADVDKEDDDVAMRAFEGVYSEAVEALLKKGRRYQLEMNSF